MEEDRFYHGLSIVTLLKDRQNTFRSQFYHNRKMKKLPGNDENIGNDETYKENDEQYRK